MSQQSGGRSCVGVMEVRGRRRRMCDVRVKVEKTPDRSGKILLRDEAHTQPLDRGGGSADPSTGEGAAPSKHSTFHS